MKTTLAILFLLAVLTLASAAPSTGGRGVRGYSSKRKTNHHQRRRRRLQKDDMNNNLQDDEDNGVTIMDILSDPNNEASYSTLASLLEQEENADLMEALDTNNPTNYTLLAPTNAAFEALDPTLLETVQNDPLLLQQILQYHVLDEPYLSSDLAVVEPGASFATLNTANNITVNATTTASNTNTITTYVSPVQDSLLTVIINGLATVTEADILASNGIVHAIDAVLIPEETQTSPPEPEDEEQDDKEQDENEEEEKEEDEKEEDDKEQDDQEQDDKEQDDDGDFALEDLLGCVQGSLADDPASLVDPGIIECGLSLIPDPEGDGGEDLFDLQGVLNCLGNSLGCEAEVAAANAATGFGQVLTTPLEQQNPDESPPASQAGMTMGELFDGN